jgi:hypothetical protein
VTYFPIQRFLFIFLSVAAFAQTNSPGWMTAPLAGLVANPELTEIRAIQGVPGASTVGRPISLPPDVRRVHLAPAQGWALVEQTSGRTLGLMSFSGMLPGSVTAIDGVLSAPDSVSFSPSGRSAVIHSKAAAKLQVLTGLDTTPTVTMLSDTSSLGEVGAAAVSDDGTLAVALTSDGRAFLLSSATAPQLIYQAGSPAGLSFLPDQTAIAIADGGSASISVMDGLNRTPFTRIMMRGPNLSGGSLLVQASADAQSLFVAALGGTTIYRADFADQTMRTLAVPAPLSRLERFRGGDSFLFSANAGEAAWLLFSNGSNLAAAFAQPTEPREPKRPLPTTDPLRRR